MIIDEAVSSLPVNQGISHIGSNGTWLSFVQPEDTLNDGELCAGCVQSTEGTPVIYNHSCCNDLTATIHCSSLGKKKKKNQQWFAEHTDITTFCYISLLLGLK